MIEKVARWIDRRVGGSEYVQHTLTKIFPESWTFLFGEVALYSFVVLVATGTFLALFFDPSLAETTYEGGYGAMQGVEMSVAYESTLRLSFDVRAGLLMRQMHHWAALIFVAAIVVHLLRVFFTGAFRRPRELNWAIGTTLLMLALLEGFAGYSLPDDLLSGTGLRIGHSILESIPLVGTWLASLLFGGAYPGEQIIGRLFTGHVFILPALLAGLIGLHLALIFRQVHTQFPGEGRREDNTVGVRLWPTYTAMSVGLLCLVVAVTALLGGLFQINPIWFYGPYDPFVVSAGSQPDWYMGWLEGALRLMPPWEFQGFGVMIPNPFFPAVLLPGLTFLGMYAYPFLEKVLTGDYREHHLLDRPRDRPGRTAFGVGMVTFYAIITVAGSDDIIAHQLHIGISGLVWFLRIALLVAPLVTGAIAYRWCRNLAASEQRPAPAGDEHAGPPGDDEHASPGESRSRDGWTQRPRWRVALAGVVSALVPGGRSDRR